MSRAVVPVSQQRKVIYEEMTTAARAAVDDIEGTIGNIVKGSVLGYWLVGNILANAFNPKNEEHFGSRVQDQFAGYLPPSVAGNSKTLAGRMQTLNELKRFSMRFRDRDFIDNWSKQPLPDGGYLELGHWLALMDLTDNEDVKTQLRRVIQTGMSARALNLLLTSGAAGPRKARRGPGRSPMIPVTPMQGLQKLFVDSQKLVRQIPVTDEHVFAKILNMPPDEITEEMLVKLKEDEVMLNSLITKSSGARDKIGDCIVRVADVLAKKQGETDKSSEKDNGAANKPPTKTPVVKPVKPPVKAGGNGRKTTRPAATPAARPATRPATRPAATKQPTATKPSGKQAAASGKKGSSRRPQPATT